MRSFFCSLHYSAVFLVKLFAWLCVLSAAVCIVLLSFLLSSLYGYTFFLLLSAYSAVFLVKLFAWLCILSSAVCIVLLSFLLSSLRGYVFFLRILSSAVCIVCFLPF